MDSEEAYIDTNTHELVCPKCDHKMKLDYPMSIRDHQVILIGFQKYHETCMEDN